MNPGGLAGGRATARGGELPQLELDCLAALWALGEAPVAQVHRRLAANGRPLAYTTVLTVLDRLRRKQAVERRKQGRAFLYIPLVSREEMRERALERMIHNFFVSRQEVEAWLRSGTEEQRMPSSAPEPPPEPEPAFLD
ncbi:MAG: BlaI/MecI/CopY family transcriptional regulator [Terriglobales bacterium]